MTELISKERLGKCVMQRVQWDNLTCESCNTLMMLEKETEFEEIKVCSECGRREVLIKKVRKE